MRSRHIDLQVFLEVGHVLSNVRELRLTNETSAPGAAVDRPEHDIFTPRRSCRGDHMLQFGLLDNERVAEHAQAAALVQKKKSRTVGMGDMDDQRQLSSSCGCVAFGTFREALADVRIQNERITCG